MKYIASVTGSSMLLNPVTKTTPVCTNLCTFYSYILYSVAITINIIVSIGEWKKQLAAHLIDYNSLDIKGTIASGM